MVAAPLVDYSRNFRSAVTMDACVRKNNFGKENKRFRSLSSEMLDKLTNVSSSVCSNEDSWVDDPSDEKIAGRAVSMVVGSARKGLVPLCATVACVLKEKMQVEKKLILAQNQLNRMTVRENNRDRLNGEDARCISKEVGPTDKKPPSLSRRCQIVLTKSCNTDAENLSGSDAKKKMCRKAVIVTEAVIHSATEDGYSVIPSGGDKVAPPTRRKRTPTQSASLVSSTDEIFDSILPVRLPAKVTRRISPPVSTVVERRRTADASTETAFTGATTDAWTNTVRDCDSHDCSATLHWKEEIRKSRKREEFLEEKLMQTSAALRESRKIVTSCSCQSSVKRTVHCNTDFTLPPFEEGRLTHDVQDRVLSWMRFSKKQLRGPLFAPSPLLGCLCRNCELLVRSDRSVFKENAALFKITHKGNPLLELNDRVMIPGNRVGCVAYIGHLDRTDTPQAVFIGIKLDRAEGDCDGIYQEKHYFYSAPNHGLFLPINNVLFIVNLKSDSRVAPSSHSVYLKRKANKTSKRLRSFSENAVFH